MQYLGLPGDTAGFSCQLSPPGLPSSSYRNVKPLNILQQLGRAKKSSGLSAVNPDGGCTEQVERMHHSQMPSKPGGGGGRKSHFYAHPPTFFFPPDCWAWAECMSSKAVVLVLPSGSSELPPSPGPGAYLGGKRVQGWDSPSPPGLKGRCEYHRLPTCSVQPQPGQVMPSPTLHARSCLAVMEVFKCFRHLPTVAAAR